MLGFLISIYEDFINFFMKVYFIKKYKYPYENHFITTEDGYILTFIRIPHGRNNKSFKRPAVLVVHGLFSSSVDYVNLGPERSLGFILADAGYDVWLANSRGNSYSKNHTVLDPYENPKEFYNFSWHEIGFFDIPAAIDHILKVNGDKSLQYIGMSQGASAFLVFASLNPKYGPKVKLATLLAPAITLDHFPMQLKAFLISLYNFLEILKNQNVYSVPRLNNIQIWLRTICKYNVFLIRSLMTLLGGGADDLQLENAILPTLLKNFPSDISLRQLQHYIQLVLTGKILKIKM